MFLVLSVSLYTSRIILKQLGVEDFGIFNLIAGVVVMFTFLNNAMNSTIQRYYNTELANKNFKNLRHLFSASLQIQGFLILLFLILAETIGLWFLNNKLNIPNTRIEAANYVYQLTVLITVFNFLRIPFNAMIIAYERMKFFAVISVVEVFLKLLMVLLLAYFKYDKLIVYSILLSALAFVILIFNYIYTKKNFEQDVHFFYQKDKKILSEMASFSGWSLFGNLALLGSNQGIAIILNLFLGVFINATMGIANQINAALYTFVSNLQIAFKPQAIQTYASGDKKAHMNFLFQTSKISYYLLLILVLPLLMNMDLVLEIWLGTVPKYTLQFSKLILIFALIDALAGPFWMSANAIGNIRNYQIILSIILMLNLPLAFILLYYGYSPILVMLIKIVLNALAYIYRIRYVLKKIKVLPTNYKGYFLALFVISVFAGCIYFVNQYFNILGKGYFKLFLSSFSSILLLLLIIERVGFTKSEKLFVTNLIKKLIKRNA